MRAVRSLALLMLLFGCGGGGTDETDNTGESVDAGTSTRGTDAGTSTVLADAARPATLADAGPPATFSEIYDSLFPLTTNGRCNFCHSMPARDTSNGKLSMGESKAAAYAALIGKSSASSHCANMPLVTPGNPDASLFLLKFSEPAPCGDRMPLGGALLTTAQVARIRSWIAAGANND